MVRETLSRGLADGLIISGPATGAATRGTDRRAAPDAFILVGSGINESNAAEVLARADGAIVGTSLKQDGIVSNPVDPDKVKRLAAVLGQSPWPILRPTHGPFGR
jgi:predicted TIM-barrel enzyme